MLLKVFFLAIIQGITEFLPISSSGHLVFFQEILSVKESQLVLDVVLHAGTLFSILIYFRKKLYYLIQPIFLWQEQKKDSFILAWKIFIATIPAAMIGVLFEEKIESYFFSVISVSVFWILNGCNLIFVDLFKKDKTKSQVSIVNSLIIGLFQVLAMIPGISRSGTTIATGSYLGISKKEAADFSFLIAIPVIAGAVILKFGDIFHADSDYSLFVLFIGFLGSMISGLIAIHFLYQALTKSYFKYFGFYTIILGSILLIRYIF